MVIALSTFMITSLLLKLKDGVRLTLARNTDSNNHDDAKHQLED
jgi:hypothetical protein